MTYGIPHEHDRAPIILGKMEPITRYCCWEANMWTEAKQITIELKIYNENQLQSTDPRTNTMKSKSLRNTGLDLSGSLATQFQNIREAVIDASFSLFLLSYYINFALDCSFNPINI